MEPLVNPGAHPPSPPPDSGAEWSYEALDLRPLKRWLEACRDPEGLFCRALGRASATTTVYDTLDRRFGRAGLELTVRHERGRHVASCVPSPGPAAAAHTPQTAELSENRGSALLHCAGPLGDRVRALAGPRDLGAVLEVRTERESFVVGRGGTDRARIHLDEHTVPSSGAPPRLRMVRVVVEPLVENDSLRDLRERIAGAGRLRPVASSAIEAAVFALGLKPPAAPELGSTTVSSRLTVAETAFAVLRAQYREWRLHEPGTRLGEDPEELHDMRVALRRMRSALRLFRDFLPPPAEALRQRLKWLGNLLGDVRDTDVQTGELSAWAGELAPEERRALHPLLDRLRRRRKRLRRRMLRGLDSQRYERLAGQAEALLRLGPGPVPAAGCAPVLAAAPVVVRGLFAKVKKRAKKAGPGAPSEDLHALRIRCKRFRYALEFFSPIYGESAAREIDACKKVQDLLGEHQDAVVAGARLQQIVRRGGHRLPADTIFQIGRLFEHYRQRMVERRAGLKKGVRRVCGKRWRRVLRSIEGARPSSPPELA